jgi:hypothetical protein
MDWVIKFRLAQEISSAVLYLHGHDIVHRDLVSLNFNIQCFKQINYYCINLLFHCYRLAFNECAYKPRSRKTC